MSAVTAGAFAARLLKHAPPDPGHLASAEAEAGRIVAKARRDADAILDAAQREAARLRQEAAASSKASADRAIAARLLESRSALDAETEALRPKLASILRAALATLVGLSCGDDALGRLVARAVEDFAREGTATVTLHPDDADSVARVLANRTGPVTEVRIDETFEPGRARLEVAGVTVELGLDEQLALFERLAAGRG